MNHKMTTIMYALGFVEQFVENNTQPISEENQPDDELLDQIKEENKYRAEVQSMMKIVAQGLEQLRREKDNLEIKVSLANSALNTP